MIPVELHDGTRLEFPDGTSDAVIDKVVKSHIKPEPTTKQSIQASIPGRVAQGMRDPIDELATMLPKGLQAITSLGGNFPNRVSDFLGSEASRVQGMNRQGEQEYQQAKQAAGVEGMDAARFTGNILSPVNAAIATKLPIAAAGAAKLIGSGAGYGAIGGALENTDVNNPDYWQEKAANTAKGAGIGAVATPVIAGAGRVISPQVNKYAKALIDKKVYPTAGQILGGTWQKLEDKAQSIPILGDMISSGRRGAANEFNKATLNEALSPIGEKVSKIGREGVLEVKTKLSDAYNNLLPKLSFKPDQQFTSELSNLRQMATGLGERESKKFNAVIDDALSKASPNGSMTGETFKIVESKLGAEAKKFSGSSDAYQKELGDALKEAQRIFRDTLPRVNPSYAGELGKINSGYAKYARIRQAASSTAAGANEGVFTPAQLAAAIKAQDKTAGKGASATGQALMQDFAEAGTNTMNSKYPDSGTVGRLLLGGGALSSGLINPVMPIGLAASGLPFVGVGRKMTAAALTQRPQGAEKLAELLRLSSPAIAAGLPVGLDSRN